ncbi:TetR/AcrR family transcriptional regulator [Halomonas cupida]|uniref:TetR/AcrR family transcriptional regulator n=1 Tax=Halomonas cupida TaxID=44933 RepID=UPI003A8FAA32
MPWKAQHKEESRERILAAAAGYFTSRGFDAVSIDEVMQQAGMTRGAFYAHFSSKAELYAHAIRQAAEHGVEQLDRLATPQQRIDAYLSQSTNHHDAACPLACLVSDVAQRDDRVRATYTALLEGFLQRFQSGEEESGGRQQALMQAVAMIGSLAMARTVDDPELAAELLDAGRTLASNSASGCMMPQAPTSTPGD